MRFVLISVAFLFSMFLTVASFGADAPFAGKYSDGKLAIDLSEAAGAYAGTITLGSQQFPASARSNGSGLEGTFSSGGHPFPFTASLAADTLTLSTGTKTYTLKRLGGAVNPLDNSGPANPLEQPANAPAGGDAPAGYTVEVSTDSGKSLIAQKSNVASVQAALEATFPELAAYFGARPAIGTAYQDAKDPKSGGATFSDNWNGHPVRGFISCKLHDGGATVAVIYGRTDGSKADWDKLMNPPAQTATAEPAAPSPPEIPLHEYDFPDGTGSIGLAEGWTTKSPTVIHAVVITGPADQVVIIGNSQLVQTPDSPNVKMMQQNQAMMQQMQARNARMGFQSPPPPPAPPMLIAPLTGPVEALNNLVPQFSKRSEYNHGPSLALGKIISSEDAPANLPGAKAAIITYTYTRTQDGHSALFRAEMHVQTSPLAQGAWMWLGTSRAAPDATFDHDLPIMRAICKSLNVNQDRAKQVGDAENAQMQQMTAQMAQQSQKALEANARQFQIDQDRRYQIHQEQMAAQEQGYAQHNAQWQSYELQKSRNAADFLETIKGTRTVYDTVTGTSGTADLNYVNGVVDSLNQAALDPNRFIQIPLRDEMYPVPGGK